MAILEMKNIRKAFSGEEILKGISLSCKEGEVLSIIGPSGSGKSTLLRIATLLEKAEGGELFYDGKAIFSLTEGQKKQATKEEKEEAKKLFGLVFQNFNLFPHWTVVKNVMDPLIHVQRKTKEEAEEKAKKAGYDIQMQGYMWLWECEEAQIDFVLFPTPYEMLSSYDSPERYIDLVEQIPQDKRITTVTVKRDEKIISKIQERVEAAQAYYQQLILEMS